MFLVHLKSRMYKPICIVVSLSLTCFPVAIASEVPFYLKNEHYPLPRAILEPKSLLFTPGKVPYADWLIKRAALVSDQLNECYGELDRNKNSSTQKEEIEKKWILVKIKKKTEYLVFLGEKFQRVTGTSMLDAGYAFNYLPPPVIQVAAENNVDNKLVEEITLKEKRQESDSREPAKTEGTKVLVQEAKISFEQSSYTTSTTKGSNPAEVVVVQNAKVFVDNQPLSQSAPSVETASASPESESHSTEQAPVFSDKQKDSISSQLEETGGFGSILGIFSGSVPENNEPKPVSSGIEMKASEKDIQGEEVKVQEENKEPEPKKDPVESTPSVGGLSRKKDEDVTEELAYEESEEQQSKLEVFPAIVDPENAVEQKTTASVKSLVKTPTPSTDIKVETIKENAELEIPPTAPFYFEGPKVETAQDKKAEEPTLTKVPVVEEKRLVQKVDLATNPLPSKDVKAESKIENKPVLVEAPLIASPLPTASPTPVSTVVEEKSVEPSPTEKNKKDPVRSQGVVEFENVMNAKKNANKKQEILPVVQEEKSTVKEEVKEESSPENHPPHPAPPTGSIVEEGEIQEANGPSY